MHLCTQSVGLSVYQSISQCEEHSRGELGFAYSQLLSIHWQDACGSAVPALAGEARPHLEWTKVMVETVGSTNLIVTSR